MKWITPVYRWRLYCVLSLCVLTAVTSCDSPPAKVDTVMLVYDKNGQVIETHYGTWGMVRTRGCMIWDQNTDMRSETNRSCSITEGERVE